MNSNAIYLVTTWPIPVIVAITFDEAAHGFAAHFLGDDTAWRLGRVSFNPAKHVDPFGTIRLPGMLLCSTLRFFGYAKPVPVSFRGLRSPRRDMVLVAAAGPVMNIALALVAALAFHIVDYLPGTSAEWLADNLRNAVILNVVLAVFNLFPLPPLDAVEFRHSSKARCDGRCASGALRFGDFLIGLLIILPMLGAQLGVNLNFISDTLAIVTRTIINAIIYITETASAAMAGKCEALG